jgi:hypothetical protein
MERNLEHLWHALHSLPLSWVSLCGAGSSPHQGINNQEYPTENGQKNRWEVESAYAVAFNGRRAGRKTSAWNMLKVRVPPEYLAALKAFAFQSGAPLAEYVRGMVHDHILQRGAAFRERGAAFRALIDAGKAWVIGYNERVAVAGGLHNSCQGRHFQWWTGRDSDPRPSGCSGNALRTGRSSAPSRAYQAELPAQRVARSEVTRPLIAVTSVRISNSSN